MIYLANKKKEKKKDCNLIYVDLESHQHEGGARRSWAPFYGGKEKVKGRGCLQPWSPVVIIGFFV